MRSHPYTPPPPLPPLLSELSTYLPNRDRKGGASDSEVALSDLDPETSRLLPRKRQKHRVRIQGKLAPVRSVSVVNLRSLSASQRAPSPRDDARLDAAVGGTLSRRRRSEDDMSSEAEDEVEERDTQLRSYGIGGRGNIRRPTDVIGTSSRISSLSLSSLFSSSSGLTTPSVSSPDRRWGLSGLLNRIEDRRAKDRGV